jgi:hypothetical protein
MSSTNFSPVKRGNFGSQPISIRGRILLSVIFLLIALTVGFAVSTGLYQYNRETMQKSDILGSLLCGQGQHVDDVPTTHRSRRMICRDASGAEVSARNNLIAVKMALPFFLMMAAPALLFAWSADFRMSKGR